MYVMPEDIEELEKLYNEALDSKKEVFKFKGKDLLTNYAKYLLEYLKERNKQ